MKEYPAPRTYAHTAALPSPLADAYDDAPLQVLLVDDDDVDRQAVRRGLSKTAGYEIEFTEATTFADAVAILKQQRFDCVFLDFRLPGGDGLRVVREAREAGVRTPIIMLTGQGDEQLAVELMKAGASDYLTKGQAAPHRLGQTLRHAVRLHRAERQAREADAARESALNARGRFYAAMSHELRTPINAIVGYNELLLSSIYGELNDEQAAGLGRAQRAARHLLELVNDVLDVSKLEAGKLELQIEDVDIEELVQDLFVTVEPLARERDTELTLHCPEPLAPVRTDPRRVRQIVLNLISNAIKFGESQPVVVGCSRQDGGAVEVAVRDRGIGIDAGDLPKIFDEFVQLPNAHPGGTGLGLPISMRLAELLGGTLDVQSEPGKGSVFRLLLPETETKGG